MSNGVNHVILVGHLGADPEMKTTPAGKQVAELRMATSRKWTDSQGQSKESTEWHRVKVWGRQAESVSRFLQKGRQVYVEGRIESRKWVDKEGHDRTAYDIVARQVVFLGGGGRRGAETERSYGHAGRMAAAPGNMDIEEDSDVEVEAEGDDGADASVGVGADVGMGAGASVGVGVGSGTGVGAGMGRYGRGDGPGDGRSDGYGTGRSPYPAARAGFPGERVPGADDGAERRLVEGEAWSQARQAR